MSGQKIKHAQNDETFFREVWRITMCGATAQQIADHLGTTPPTIRRAQHRIRNNRVQNPTPENDVLGPLHAAATKHRLINFLSWERYIGVLRQFYFGGQDVNFEDKHRCLIACSHRLTPRKFTQRFITYRHFDIGKYTLNLIDFKDGDALNEELRQVLKCRSCYLGGYKLPVFADFQADPYLFLTLMFYLSRFRFREPDYHQIMLIYMEAVFFGMIQELVMKVAEDARLAGASVEDATEKASEFFLDITDQMFDRILLGL